MPQQPDPGGPMPSGPGIIELRLRDLSQLFDALDPSPFHEKDLDHRTEEYIVGSARELPGPGACSLRVLLDEPRGVADQRAAAGAIQAHFRRRSRVLRRELRQLLRRGLISLGIGVAFLAVFFILAQLVGQLLGESRWATLFQEGLLIVGWVAMWRPLEIFLYDWWPIVGERRLCDRLSAVPVQIVSSDPGQPNRPPTSDPMPEARALARWENEGGRVPTSLAARG